MRYRQFLRRFKRFVQGVKKLLASDVEGQIRNIVKSRHDLLHIFDGFSDPIIVIDKQFVIRRVNRAFPRLWTKNHSCNLFGDPAMKCCMVSNNAVPSVRRRRLLLPVRRPLASAFFMEGQENSSRPIFNITCYPMINEEGEVISIAEYYRDFSDFLNLTRQLCESERAGVMEPLVVGL